MSVLSLLIKPASSNCNLQCKYCFYNVLSEKREVASHGIMDYETLKEIIKKAFEYATEQCIFAFQGGEPTLAGINFYKELIELQKKYNKNHISIINTVQTNGILIDENWASFFYENNFLIGVSLDGTKDLHDINRVDGKNNGSFNKVMKGIRLLNKYKVEYNIIFVVSAKTARHANKIYNYFKKNNFNYLQFIPCIDPIEDIHGTNEYSLSAEVYGQFLKSIFDLWYLDVLNGHAISIRYFDNLIKRVMGYNTEACGMNGICGCQFVVEANGGVYPCDFYAVDKWYMGSIMDKSIQELNDSDIVKEFIQVSEHISEECRSCKWLNLCRGGCRRDRETTNNDKLGLNYYCTSYKEFFDYSYERLYRLARTIGQKR
jgi:uncharacterized protein